MGCLTGDAEPTRARRPRQISRKTPSGGADFARSFAAIRIALSKVAAAASPLPNAYFAPSRREPLTLSARLSEVATADAIEEVNDHADNEPNDEPFPRSPR
jgi:hypothetical protein